MGVTRAATAPWFLMMVFLWPFGCSMIQPAVHKNIPPPAPVPQTTELLPESQSQQASLQEELSPPPPPSPPEIKYFSHEIKWPGEDLSSIARWYTGSAKNWMRLVEVNPGIDPRRINIGDSVLIPEDLLKTRKLMPIDFLLPTTNKKIAPPPPSPPEVKYFSHEIKWPGEDLSSIARWYTGSAKNWMRLVEVNPGIDPRRINIGDLVLIPEDLLKTRKLMPIDFLPSTTKKKAPPPPPAKQVVKSDKITLFGPIDTLTETSSVDNSDSPLPLETIE